MNVTGISDLHLSPLAYLEGIAAVIVIGVIWAVIQKARGKKD